ncbi:MAG: hypothetical protein K2K09_08330, partial [Lachnospiraceae bacterium]|nr:hypothetical protein [Lachnospiraceae bacterium]
MESQIDNQNILIAKQADEIVAIKDSAQATEDQKDEDISEINDVEENDNDNAGKETSEDDTQEN